MLFACYPNCSTCQKAQKWLDENSVAYELRNIKTENPSFQELSEWYEKSGLPIKRFWNTSGINYRKLNLKDRLSDMNEEEQLKLLSTDGLLVKRPVLVEGNCVLLGFKQSEWEGLID